MYLNFFEDHNEFVSGTETRVLQYRFDLRAWRIWWMRMMMRRVTNLKRRRIRGVCQWRRVLMMRRCSVAVMMMRRRVNVTVPVTHRVMVRTRGTVHVIQEIIV